LRPVGDKQLHNLLDRSADEPHAVTGAASLGSA
jgi:hypothetical protein